MKVAARTGLVICVVALGALVTTLVARGSSQYPIIPSGQLLQNIQADAENLGKGNLDPTSIPPSSAQVVLTNRGAASAAGTWVESLDPSTQVYVVQLQGSFVGNMAKVPDAKSIPRGSALVFLYDPASNQLTDWGIAPQPWNLSALGQVSVIPVNISSP
jgi:hypothetical protein